MKKMLLIVTGLSLILSACLPAFLQQPTANPAPPSDLQGTAAVLVQASLEALPTPTIAPSITPVVMTETSTITPVPITPTETQNPIFLTLTATLGTGTVAVTPGTPTVTATGTLPTSTSSPTRPFSLTPTGTDHPRFYGTQPPALPFGSITLINKSKVDVYISLQCTTKDGYTTIIEYPVEGTVNVNAPAGKYLYVAWVGGKQMIGNFGLDKRQELTLKIYKDHIDIK